VRESRECRCELPSQFRQHVLQRRRSCARRRITPEQIDETVGGDDPPGFEQEHRKQCPLLMSGNDDCAAVTLDLEWAQDPEIERRCRP
jgi:hypothetical protein